MTEPAERAGRSGGRIMLFAVGCLLIGGAVWAVSRNQEQAGAAWRAMKSAPPGLLALFIALPLVNLALTATTMWILTGRYGRVRFGEMAALIASAWLLNLLPLRLGMVGRIAYHKKYNDVRVRDSLKVIVKAMACTVGAIALLLVAVALAPAGIRGAPVRGDAGAMLADLFWVVFPYAVIVACGAVYLRVSGRGADGRRAHSWRWGAALLCRFADIAVWWLRYLVTFALLGQPLGLLQGAAVTAASQAAMVTPVQLGFREWVVGVVTAAAGAGPLHAGPGQGAVSHLESVTPGLLADLTMRGCEVLATLPIAVGCIVWMTRRTRREGRQGCRVVTPPAE